MSTWYDVTVKAFGHEDHLSKLLNIKSEDAKNLNYIKLSFGQKNGPGVDLENLAKNNSELTFLITVAIESYTGSVFLFKYDNLKNIFQYVPLIHYDYDNIEYNEKLLSESAHLMNELNKTNHINWDLFIYNREIVKSLLDNYDQYQNLVSRIFIEDLEFDNLPLESND